jgi:hypothetical protein
MREGQMRRDLRTSRTWVVYGRWLVQVMRIGVAKLTTRRMILLFH